jgi:hypothetical protein
MDLNARKAPTLSGQRTWRSQPSSQRRRKKTTFGWILRRMIWIGHATNREIEIGMMGADIEEAMVVMVAEANGEEEAVTVEEVTK